MFAKKETTEATNTIIGEGVRLEAALLTGSRSVRVDGEFWGDINIDGSLILGETGSIYGNVTVKYMLVAGRIDGNITCNGALHLASSCIINGDIDTVGLIVDEGACMNGSCKMKKESMLIADNRREMALLT